MPERTQTAVEWAEEQCGGLPLQARPCENRETDADKAERKQGIRARLYGGGPPRMHGACVALDEPSLVFTSARRWAPARVIIEGDAAHGTEGRAFLFRWAGRGRDGVHMYIYCREILSAEA